MDENEHIRPPGTDYETLKHPSGVNSVEVAVVQDHRFVFYYWLKWKNKIGAGIKSPSLISFDWHEDLAAPDEYSELKALNTKDYKSVALFCWDKLNSTNDGHILSAAYLDLIGDIYVVRKQNTGSRRSFRDINGKSHKICCYKSAKRLFSKLKQVQDDKIFFDLDLDYFTESPDFGGGGKELQLVPDKKITEILNPTSELFCWIFKRLAGMTIATEPKCCGGYINSNHLFSVVTDSFFRPQLFSQHAKWKHHTDSESSS